MLQHAWSLQLGSLPLCRLIDQRKGRGTAQYCYPKVVGTYSVKPSERGLTV